MPEFRGIDKEEIITSIKAAVEFLNRLNVGPETAKAIDSWLNGDNLAKISAASSEKELAKVMSETSALSDFIFLSDILHYHAKADTDGVGDEIFADLSRWGAFSGMRHMHMAYTPLDGEIDNYILIENARQILNKASDPRGYDSQYLQQKLSDFSVPDDFTMSAVLTNLRSFLDALQEKGKKGAKDAFEALDLRHRHVLGQTFAHILYYGHEAPVYDSPMVRYGIAFPDVVEKDGTRTMDMDNLKLVMDEVQTILSPYYETMEVMMTSLGFITDYSETGKTGVVFITTRRVAQAVANALPQYTVIDYKGNEIKPDAPSSGMAPKGPSPQP